MDSIQLHQDILTESLTEVESASSSYYDNCRGLTVRQSFYVYPDDSVVSLKCCDGSYDAIEVVGEELSIFRSIFSSYFKP